VLGLGFGDEHGDLPSTARRLLDVLDDGLHQGAVRAVEDVQPHAGVPALPGQGPIGVCVDGPGDDLTTPVSALVLVVVVVAVAAITDAGYLAQMHDTAELVRSRVPDPQGGAALELVR
jgi:hypothetical protein